MKAITVNQPGGVDQLIYSEIEQPRINPNQILVKNKIAGLNFIDIYLRTGLYPVEKYPFVPGMEGCGEIVEVGSKVSNFKTGDRVAYFNGNSGTYAEYVAIAADRAVPIPAQINDETAAAAMLQGLTAYYLSHLTFQLKPQHIALVHAGAGGVGLLLIQIAKKLGATVITTVSNPDKASLVKTAGADYIINYSQESVLDKVMQFTDKRGVDVVYDAVGKDTFFIGLDCLINRGMMISYGQASGPIPPFDLKLLSSKALYLTRPSLFNYTKTTQELIELSNALFKMILNNDLKIQIGQRYPLKDAAKAQQDLEQRKTVAKSLLLIV